MSRRGGGGGGIEREEKVNAFQWPGLGACC